MAYLEFYADASGGSDANAGSTTGAAAFSDTAGAWSTVTNVYTAAGTVAGVSIGDWVAIYTGSTTTFVAQVTNVSAGAGGTITVSATIRFGTPPVTGTANLKAGGAHASPAPFCAMGGGILSGLGFPCVNMKNTANYALSTGLSISANGPILFQGYSSTPRDGGTVTIDGSTNAIVLWTITGSQVGLRDMVLQNNGTTGTNAGLSLGGNGWWADRVVVHAVRGDGFLIGAFGVATECEAYSCNGAANQSCGFKINVGTTASAILRRCVSHDNLGTNAHGFNVLGGGGVLDHCISHLNGGNGVNYATSAALSILGGSYRKNSGDGIKFAPSARATLIAENVNAVNNTGFGLNVTQPTNGALVNLQELGTFGNGSGATNGVGFANLEGAIAYGADPEGNVGDGVAPRAGNFNASTASARGAGRGNFTQASASYSTATVASPDIGAGQNAGGAGAVIRSANPITWDYEG